VGLRLLEYRLLSRSGRLLDCVVYKLVDHGEEYYRVLKLLRLLRNPRELAQVETLLDMHQDIVSAFKHETRARLVLIAVYSRKLGLIWCYDVASADILPSYTLLTRQSRQVLGSRNDSTISGSFLMNYEAMPSRLLDHF